MHKVKSNVVTMYNKWFFFFSGLERTFSSFGLVHTKLRNRLRNDRVMKLVRVYAHLRSDNQETFDNFDAVKENEES